VHDRDLLAEEFNGHRQYLQAVAYRMLGSLSEAEDAVQESWLRLSRSDADAVANMRGWLTTVVGRVCLDILRARRSRREVSADAWLPEPIVSLETGTDPEEEALLADSVGLALLVVLDMLTPAERLAFVLHDMFDVPFEEIADIVGRSPAAARQLASRGRRRVRGAAPTPATRGCTPRRTSPWSSAGRFAVRGSGCRSSSSALRRSAPPWKRSYCSRATCIRGCLSCRGGLWGPSPTFRSSRFATCLSEETRTSSTTVSSKPCFATAGRLSRARNSMARTRSVRASSTTGATSSTWTLSSRC